MIGCFAECIDKFFHVSSLSSKNLRSVVHISFVREVSQVRKYILITAHRKDYVLTNCFYFAVAKVTTHCRLLTEDERLILLDQLPVSNITLLSLQAFETEQQFNQQLRYVLTPACPVHSASSCSPCFIRG